MIDTAELNTFFKDFDLYSSFCNAEEKDSIIANESEDNSCLSNSCFVDLDKLNN